LKIFLFSKNAVLCVQGANLFYKMGELTDLFYETLLKYLRKQPPPFNFIAFGKIN